MRRPLHVALEPPPLAPIALRSACLLVASALSALPLRGQGVRDAPASGWTVDDVIRAESADQFEISPDQRWVVWVRTTVDSLRGPASNLWITRLSDGESWPLTRGHRRAARPRWSPDGRYIAFTSLRAITPRAATDASAAGDSTPQLWVMRQAGGEPWPLTRGVRGLGAFQWAPTGPYRLLFVARDPERRFERERARRRDTGWAVEDTLATPPSRIWRVDVASGAIERLTHEDERIEEMALAPDGRRAVLRIAVSLSYTFDGRAPPKTYVADLETGRRREVLAGQRMVPRDLAWNVEGTGFYFSYGRADHPVYWDGEHLAMAFYDAEHDRLMPIDLDWDRGLGGAFGVVPDGFVAALADGVHDQLAHYRFERGRWRRQLLEGAHARHAWAWAVSGDGHTLVYRTSTATTPDQVYAARLVGGEILAPKPLARLNPAYEGKPALDAEVVRWIGANDEQVEGILYYPMDYRPGRPYPLIVSLHGGPSSRDRDAWSSAFRNPIVLFAQRGAFVFKPNYHGSSGYGQAWLESIAGGKYYSLEVPDIERGVDHLIARGLVHPDSIATQGWSNGAILSTALTVENPSRYRASIAGAGDVEWISDWGNVDFGAVFDNYYFGASPLEDPQRYIDLSPFFRLDTVRTPTLIFFGTEDRAVPPSQGWSHFRALQQLGHAPVRFVLFPGEPHGLEQVAHQRRKIDEELAWLDRYVWGRAADPAHLALAEGSPLAALEARSAARLEGRLFGERVGEVLAPETVSRGDVEIGRFEVTRAQWQAYRPDYPVPEGTANHPVGGITFEQASAYAAWLSAATNRTYRLPTSAELEALAGGTGVTLDYWAGYPVGAEDAGRLLAVASRLGPDAPLLREVGSPAADVTAPPALFDLEGNVSEWVIADDGRPALFGASADRPRDVGSRTGEAGEGYRGVRVVREP